MISVVQFLRIKTTPLRSVLFALIALLIHPHFALGEEDIQLGVIASLTGPAAEQGKSWVEGVELAVHELRQEGSSISIIYEDDQTNPAQAARAFQRLVLTKGVRGIIGGTWDYLAETLSPLARQRKIAVLTPTNPPELLSDTAKSNPYFFTTGLTLKAERKAIESFLRERKPSTAAIFYPNLPWGESHAVMMRSILEELGVNIVIDTAFEDEGYLSAAQILALRLKEKRPELLYAPIDHRGLDVLTKEFRRLRYDPLIICSQHLHTAVGLASEKKRYARTFGVYPKIDRDDFASRFRSLHGSSPGVYAGAGYDSVLFLVEALKRGVRFESPSQEFSLAGVTGTIRFPPRNRSLIENEAQILGLDAFYEPSPRS